MTPDHQQDPADLRQQRQQDKAKHGEVVARWPKHAMGNPCDELDRGVVLGIRRLPDRYHSGVEDPATFGDSRARLALAKSVPPFHRGKYGAGGLIMNLYVPAGSTNE